MAKRHSDAVAIQQGACNPSGIALSLIDAIREVRAENGDVRKDAACRLITHQLAFLMGVDEIDNGSDTLLYNRLLTECEEKSNG